MSSKSARNTSLRRHGLLIRGNSNWPAACNCCPLRPLQTSLFSPRSGQALSKLLKLATSICINTTKLLTIVLTQRGWRTSESTCASNCLPLQPTSRFCGRRDPAALAAVCSPTDRHHALLQMSFVLISSSTHTYQAHSTSFCHSWRDGTEETDARPIEETSVHLLVGQLTGAEIIMALTHARCSVTL